MLPLSKLSKKQNKNPDPPSKFAQDLLQKARLAQRSFGTQNPNTVSSSRYTSKASSRKQSLHQTQTKPTVSTQKTSKKTSVQKQKPKPKPEKKNNIFSMANGQSLQFHIDISKLKKKEEVVDKQSFRFLYVIGKGGFGKVWWVENKKTGVKYAMKEMKKGKIIAKRSIHSVINEKSLLAGLNHPFIVNMNCAFQDRQNLYMVLDLLTGGDFRYYLGWKRRFKENEAKFYIGCIIVGLQYLHSKNIIHRDIKPENLVLDEKGYLKITDLGVARELKPNNSSDTSGTPGYMSPEVMCCQDHGFAADYYAVGVILYEMMLGKRPYQGKSRKQIRDHMLSKQALIKQSELPDDWSASSMSIVNKLLQRNPLNRLGTNKISDIKQHEWFAEFSWNNLVRRVMAAPFIPKPVNMNRQYREQISESSEEDVDSETLLLLRQKNVEDLFEGYDYKPTPATKREISISSSRQQSSRVLTAKTKVRNSSQITNK